MSLFSVEFFFRNIGKNCEGNVLEMSFEVYCDLCLTFPGIFEAQATTKARPIFTVSVYKDKMASPVCSAFESLEETVTRRLETDIGSKIGE